MRGGCGRVAFVSAALLGGVACSPYAGSASGEPDAGGFTNPDVASKGGCVAAGFACIPEPPTGWNGPFALYDGNPANAPACAGALAFEALTDARADLAPVEPAACSACECGPPSGATCGPVVLHGHGLSGCGGCDGGMLSLINGQCARDLTSCGGSYSASHSVTAAVASGGGCTPTLAVPTRPPVTFRRMGIGCGAPNVAREDCANGSVCAPRSTPPFEAGLCVSTTGDVACPGAPYSGKHVFYKSLDDTRVCSPCTCGAAKGMACPSSITFYDQTDSSCATSIAGPYTLPLACQSGGVPLYVRATIGAATGGSCDATGGGEPVGAATPTNPITVCCAQ